MKNDQHSVEIPTDKLFIKKTSSVRKLKISLLSAVILLVIFCIAVIFLGVNYSDVNDELDSICRTSQCIRSASIILQSMNKSVDPCDNFYEYACGRWRFDHPIPPTSMSNTWSVEKNEAQNAKIQQFLEKSISDTEAYSTYVAKTMYKACMDTYKLDELGTEPLKEILDQMSLPLLPPLQESDYDLDIDINSLLARIKTTIDHSIILHGTVMRDVRNKTRNIITINGPTDDSTLPSKKFCKKRISRYYLRKKESVEDDEHNVSGPWERYYSYIIKYFLKATNVSNVTDEMVSDTATTLLNIAYNIESVGDDKEISTPNTAHPTLMTLSELQNMTDEASKSEDGLTSKINWRQYLETLFENTDISVDFDTTEIAVYTLEYYKMISKVLSNYSDHEIVLYLWSEVIYALIPYINEEMRIMQHTLLRPLGETTAEPRRTHCSNAVMQILDNVLAYELMKDVDLKSIQEDVKKMIDNIQYAAMKNIEAADWIDSITKSAIIEKSRNIKRQIGYPKSLLSIQELDYYYAWLNVSEETHMFNFVNASQALIKSTLDQLYEENNYTDSDFNPLDINAYYNPTTNSIKIPLGILQFPFYDLGLDALNYGAIGGVIGHELTHAFDKEGKEYDKDGNVRIWWNNSTTKRYLKRTECFTNHYNQYYVEEIERHVDGNLTLSENLADNVGIKDAFYGYQKLKAEKDKKELKLPGLEEFSDDKLFFFGFAHYNCENWTPKYMEQRLEDEHSPNFASVLGVLKNSKEFSKTWDCPAKSKMNPKNKCQLW